MNSHLRTSSIQRVMDSMHVTARQFEEFGGKLTNYLLTVPLLHRGINVLGHPVGSTVDSYTDDGRVVFQYSAEKNYFGGMASKPVDDVLHALKMKDKTEHIFLVALDDCEPLEEERLKKRLTDAPGFVGRTIYVYNRRRIAEYIVDNLLLLDEAVETLANYLPAIREISDEHSANLLIPSVALSYKSRDVDREIVRLLETEKCIFLCGVGGIGKSQAAAAYAEGKAFDFEFVVWADGGAIKDIADLHSVALGRAGVRRNVVSLLRTRRCLLVIDDLSVKIERQRFAELCGKSSRVIVTQRERVAGGFEVPLMDEAMAKAVLTHGVNEAIDDRLWREILETVGGHPLSLGLLNAAARDGSTWDELVADCARLGEYEDDYYERVVDRLLKRFHGALGTELGVVKWLNSKETYRPLLKELVGNVGVGKLERHSLVAPSRLSVVRLHDVIFSALRSASWLAASDDGALTDALDSYLTKAAQSPAIDLKAAALLHQSKLRALIHQGQKRPSFVYAMLQSWRPEELDRSMVEEPSDVLARLERSGRPPEPIETALVLELVESLYRADKEQLDKGKSKEEPKVSLQNLENRLTIFERLAKLPGLTALQNAELVHHKGKALALIGRLEDARECFEAALAGPHPMYEARLQLVKVLSRLKERSDAIQQADIVLTAAGRENLVSTSVALATICAVPSGQERDELMTTHADVLEREILRAADAGLEQAFETLVAVSRSWRYRDAERLRSVWSSVELPSPHDDKSRAIMAELFQSAAHVHPDEKDEYLARAVALYSEIKKWDDFWLQQRAEALINSGDYSGAFTSLDSMKEQTPWSHYNRSKALLRVGNSKDALDSIETAIATLPAANANFRSAFLAQRFETRLARGDSAAIDDLETALSEVTTEHYRSELSERLKSYHAASPKA